MSQQQQLQAIKSALQADSKAQIIELTEHLSEEFNRRRETENKHVPVANTIRLRASEGSDQEAAAQEFFIRLEDVTRQRAVVDKSLILYLTDETDSIMAINAVESALEATKAMDDAIDRVRIAKAGFRIPPILMLTGPNEIEIPKGDKRSFDVTLDNLGTIQATDLLVTADSTLGAVLEPMAIENISPNSFNKIMTTLIPNQTGIFEYRITARTETESTVKAIRIIVADKTEYIEAAIAQVISLEQSLDQYASFPSSEKKEDESERENRSEIENEEASFEVEIETEEAALEISVEIEENEVEIGVESEVDGSVALAAAVELEAAKQLLTIAETVLSQMNKEQAVNNLLVTIADQVQQFVNIINRSEGIIEPTDVARFRTGAINISDLLQKAQDAQD